MFVAPCTPLLACRRYAGQPAVEQGGGEAGPSSSAAAAAAAGTSSQAAAGSSKGKRSRSNAAGAGSSRAAGDPADPDDDVDEVTGQLVSEQGFWTCRHCTLRNEDVTAEACDVCGLPRREEEA